VGSRLDGKPQYFLLSIVDIVFVQRGSPETSYDGTFLLMAIVIETVLNRQKDNRKA